MNGHNSLQRTYLSQSVGYNQTHFGIASFLNTRKEKFVGALHGHEVRLLRTSFRYIARRNVATYIYCFEVDTYVLQRGGCLKTYTVQLIEVTFRLPALCCKKYRLAVPCPGLNVRPLLLSIHLITF